ncbi:recombinase family protein [Micromonospora sp. DSM 115977]|uniref:Recombinase family protein n=1 Tax=Micromonospora reichwaldensis TaxID=3075516 RepID=A0ABU2X4R0_9ACTN|nr:recombinase family protein [Micromonospora sp. DSM 115977]MDT0532631.1 recombinase family protein [Micromonospora sp. DSM 115977]
MTNATLRDAIGRVRAIIYIRLSSHRGDIDPSTSPARQEEICRAYCLAKGWDVHPYVVRDLDVSGSDKGLRLDRPGLREIRERWPDVDVVIFAKLDRLARNVVDFRAFADEAAENGAALVSVAESLDLTTTSGRFVATILAAFAEMEAATIAERTAAGIEGARKLGRWAGGAAPYGFQVVPAPDGPGFVLAPEPEAAAIVREAADRVLDGESLYSISKDFNARGVPTRSAKLIAEGRTRREKPAPWATQTLSQVLTNPATVGRSVHRGELIRDESGMPRQLWAPILPLDTWHQLCANLAANGDGAEGRGRRVRAARLLSGVARCGGCGRKLYASSRKHRSGANVPTYACAARRNGQGCQGVAVSAEPVEEYVEREFLAMVGRFPLVELVTVAVDDGRRADVEAAISATAQQMTERGADVAALAARLSALHVEREALPATAPTEVRRIETGQTFAEAWGARDVDGRRVLLEWAGAVVTVKRASVPGRKVFEEGRIALALGEFADPEAARLAEIAAEESS